MKKRIGFISILIGLLFFLNSSQYLSWFYILGNTFDAKYVDLVGQILGKLFQAIGIIVFCFYVKFYKNRPNRILEFSILIAVNFVITVFAIAPPPPWILPHYRSCDEHCNRNAICTICIIHN